MGGILAHPVERLLDGDDAGVLAGAADELLHRPKALVRMEEQHVLRAQGIEDGFAALLGKGFGQHRMHGLVLEAGPVQSIEGHERREGHRPLDPVDLKGLELQDVHEEAPHVRGHGMGHLQPHHIPETALVHQIAHGFQQVVGLVLLDLHIRVAGDAEQGGIDDLHTGEEHGQMLLHQRLQQDDVIVPRIGAEAQRGVALGFLAARREDETREIVGDLQAGIAGDAMLVLELHQEVQRQGRDDRQRMAGVDGLRRQRREDLVRKILVKEFLLLAREVAIAHEAHPALTQMRHQPFAPVLLRLGQLGQHQPPDLRQLAAGRRLVRAGGRHMVLILPLHVGHTDHEKFVKIAAENAEELELLQQGLAAVQPLVEHTGVEFQPAGLPVDVQTRAGQIMDLRLRALPQRLAVRRKDLGGGKLLLRLFFVLLAAFGVGLAAHILLLPFLRLAYTTSMTK